MRDVNSSNFGLLIAFVVPGFTTILGMSYLSPTISQWIGSSTDQAPTVGGFLYVTIGSVAAGMTVSAARWIIIDSVHAWTGVSQPRWRISKLAKAVSAYNLLIEIHYRHYQFHSNMCIALVFVYVARKSSLGLWGEPIGLLDAGFFVLLLLFFVTSRDNLRKYYGRVEQLLSE